MTQLQRNKQDYTTKLKQKNLVIESQIQLLDEYRKIIRSQDEIIRIQRKEIRKLKP